jgi:hypothetical protein
MDYGFLLSASQAAPILALSGVAPDTDLGYDSVSVDYNGKTYWVIQTEVRFPNPTSSSPDGWHVVYSPTPEEIKIQNPTPQEPFNWNTLLTLAAVGIGAYVLVNAMHFFKKD